MSDATNEAPDVAITHASQTRIAPRAHRPRKEDDPRRRAVAGQTYAEPAREIPLVRETDVLVVGGGPAGCAAAVAAARLGADVMLVERYGHLGGLSTGGLVIWIDRMTDWSGEQVIAGFASDLLERLPKDALLGPSPDLWGTTDPAVVQYWADRSAAYRGTVTWSPTIDPEHLKIAYLDLVTEAGVTLVLHAWGVAPMLEDGRVTGAIFESKQGRQAIRARVVVDTTGDGDLYAGAGASFDADVEGVDIHHCINVAFLWAGVDMETWWAFKTSEPAAHAELMQRGQRQLGLLERPSNAWRNDVALFMGPRLSGYSALDVDDLTAVERESRRRMLEHLDYFRRHAPGFENAWAMLTAPQLGVRHSRRLAGLNRVRHTEWKAGVRYDDEIGVSPPTTPSFPNVSIPYGSLVPAGIDNLLAAGRHLSCDPQSHVFLREIPQCWVTGQAAGVAAALAAGQDIRVQDVNVGELQGTLLSQGAFVRLPASVTPRAAAR